MTYQLRRLRLHGLIQRVPKTNRYRATSFGLRAAFLLSRTDLRLLRPAMSLDGSKPCSPPGMRSPARSLRKLDRAFDLFLQDTHLVA